MTKRNLGVLLMLAMCHVCSCCIIVFVKVFLFKRFTAMSLLEFSPFVIVASISSEGYMLGIQNSKMRISNFAC